MCQHVLPQPRHIDFPSPPHMHKAPVQSSILSPSTGRARSQIWPKKSIIRPSCAPASSVHRPGKSGPRYDGPRNLSPSRKVNPAACGSVLHLAGDLYIIKYIFIHMYNCNSINTKCTKAAGNRQPSKEKHFRGFPCLCRVVQTSQWHQTWETWRRLQNSSMDVDVPSLIHQCQLGPSSMHYESMVVQSLTIRRGLLMYKQILVPGDPYRGGDFMKHNV